MRTFILNNTITPRRIKYLISDIELCKSNIINLYLSSHGGEVWMADIFIDFTKKTKKKINIIGAGMMASACLKIFLNTKGKKSLLPNTGAMMHLSEHTVSSRDLLNKNSYDSACHDNLQKSNESELAEWKAIFMLLDKEVSILKNGGDIAVNYERLKKSLKKIK